MILPIIWIACGLLALILTLIHVWYTENQICIKLSNFIDILAFIILGPIGLFIVSLELLSKINDRTIICVKRKK